MKEILEKAGIGNPDKVVVTGYSAGGFGTALLSDDIYTNYFPNAKSKIVNILKVQLLTLIQIFIKR